MAKINLRKFYPYYREDCYIEVSEKVKAELRKSVRLEENYLRLLRWHGAYYTVDIHDKMIVHDPAFMTASPEAMYLRKAMVEQLYNALNALPDKQRQRVYGHYIWNLPMCRIAELEGVDESAVRRSIERGLRQMRKTILENF